MTPGAPSLRINDHVLERVGVHLHPLDDTFRPQVDRARSVNGRPPMRRFKALLTTNLVDADRLIATLGHVGPRGPESKAPLLVDHPAFEAQHLECFMIEVMRAGGVHDGLVHPDVYQTSLDIIEAELTPSSACTMLLRWAIGAIVLNLRALGISEAVLAQLQADDEASCSALRNLRVAVGTVRDEVRDFVRAEIRRDWVLSADLIEQTWAMLDNSSHVRRGMAAAPVGVRLMLRGAESIAKRTATPLPLIHRYLMRRFPAHGGLMAEIDDFRDRDEPTPLETPEAKKKREAKEQAALDAQPVQTMVVDPSDVSRGGAT